MKRYLLGNASEAEKEEVEERLISEAGFDEELDALEDQLIRDELRGELSAGDRELFHRNLLRLPEANTRYQMIRAFMEADRQAAPVAATGAVKSAVKGEGINRTAWSWLLAAAAVVAAFAVGTQLANRTAGPSVPAAAPVPIPAFVLAPGDVRGSRNEPKRFPIPASSSAVRLSVRFESAVDYSSYEAAISSVDRDVQTWGLGNLHATGAGPERFLELEVPAASLPPGDYTLKLTGRASGSTETLQGYSFSVIRPERE